MSAEHEGRNRRRVAIAAVAVLAVAVAVLFAELLSRTESAQDVVVAPSPTAPGVTPPAATSSEAAPASESSTSRKALAAFAAAEGPAHKSAVGDVTGDGVDEAVLASVRNNAVSIVVGTWDGEAYQRTFTDAAGPAQRITRVRIEDLNGKPGAEIVTEQASGTQGRSISIWGRGRGGVQRQTAKGGCWDGSSTYGIAGATVANGRISATCDGSPEPESSWSSDIYEWRKGRWTYVRSTEPGA